MKKYIIVIISCFLWTSLFGQETSSQNQSYNNILVFKGTSIVGDNTKLTVSIIDNHLLQITGPEIKQPIEVKINQVEKTIFKHAPVIMYEFSAPIPHDFKWEKLLLMDMRKLNHEQKMVIANNIETDKEFIIGIIGKPMLKLVANLVKGTIN